MFEDSSQQAGLKEIGLTYWLLFLLARDFVCFV